MEKENHTKYNRKKFAELTYIAMAHRKPFQFAKNLQIPPRYLAVLLSGKKEIPPKLNLIEKIAKESLGRVTFEELADTAGYGVAGAFPKKVRLSEWMGTWEVVHGRLMNEEALLAYLKRMTQRMTAEDLSNLFDEFGTDSLDYEDFMIAAGYQPRQCRILREKDLKPGNIKIPEEFLNQETR